MPNQKTETEIYDEIQKLDNSWLSTRSLDEKRSIEEKIKNLYAEAKKFRKPKLGHPESCKCEDCMKKLAQYNKRNNTTYETEFIWF